MTDQQLLNTWVIGLIVTGVIVVIAAALLLGVWMAARRIQKTALVALDKVKQVQTNTQIVWALQDTNKLVAQLYSGAQSILAHAGAIAQALHKADIRQGKA